jgi:magnesium transporter
LPALVGRFPVTWINVDGLGDMETIRRLGEIFNIHRLTLEDIVNHHQRPKLETYEDHIYIVTRIPHTNGHLISEQISIILGQNHVLTFQERLGDCFDPVRERLRRKQGRIRALKSDYLTYALLDAATDSFFPVLEIYGERVEALEQQALTAPDPPLIRGIHAVKRDFLTLRRAVWPLREMMNGLIRDETPLISDLTRLHFRDCYDHTVQLMDVIETYREIASGLFDIYHSSISTKINEIMKVLTIITTLFIPMSFIAGLYGMNFDRTASPWNMPELSWYFGYPAALGMMAIAAVGMLFYFRSRGWIGQRKRRTRPMPSNGSPRMQKSTATAKTTPGKKSNQV